MVNWHDPYERAAFIKENEAKADELRRDLAERQARLDAGFEPQPWRAPEPEPQPVQRTMSRDTSREWSAHIETRIAAAQRATNKRIDQRFAAYEEAVGKALGLKAKELREEYEGKLAALTTEVQQIRALVLAQDEGVVLPMDKALRRRAGGDAA
jgi:hypothetical protein